MENITLFVLTNDASYIAQYADFFNSIQNYCYIAI